MTEREDGMDHAGSKCACIFPSDFSGNYDSWPERECGYHKGERERREKLESDLAEARRLRDAEWREAICPGNEGTTVGDFCSTPERAALYLREKEQLDREEGDAALRENEALREKVRAVEAESIRRGAALRRLADAGNEYARAALVKGDSPTPEAQETCSDCEDKVCIDSTHKGYAR